MRKWIRLLVLLALAAAMLLTMSAAVAEECQHDGPWHYAANDTGHWKVCELCYLALPKEDHTLQYSQYEYNDPDYHQVTCDVCDYRAGEPHDTYVYIDEETHSASCNLCGYSDGVGKHRSKCTNRTVCMDCGKTYAGGEIVHSSYVDWNYTAAGHWFTCSECHDPVSELRYHEPSSYDPDRCNCGYVLSGEDAVDPDDCAHANVRYLSYERDFAEVGATVIMQYHKLVCDDCGAVLEEMIKHEFGDYYPLNNRCARRCEICGFVDSGFPHQPSCDGGPCHICGFDCTEIMDELTNFWHDHQTSVAIDDETHNRTCACGVVNVIEKHTVDKDDPSVCQYCGAKLNSEEDEHEHRYVIAHDAKSHWEECLDCGDQINEDEHYILCGTQGDVCEVCGETYNTDYFYEKHEGPIENGFDETYHWTKCLGCGTTFFLDTHFVLCTEIESGKCYECGQPYGLDNIGHFNWDWEDLEYNETEHWAICQDCGKEAYRDKHVTREGDPEGICSYCGYVMESAPTPTPRPTATATPRPTATATPEPTATPEVTEEPEPTETPETTEEPKRDIPTLDNDLGKLAIVDEDGEVVDYTGFETFEGAEFYFEDGVIRDDMDGLTLIDGTWRNMDHGRFNTGDGMVFFEGAAFLVKGGLVDETQSGLIDYNGQRFVFSYGQFQTDVYGAWPDPISGRFVYVWAGQFYPITDLVSYNGQVFYFVDGYLATDFTGVVKDFQGTEFNIIGGQAY